MDFRNRVQEIVGATHYVNRRFGSMLPPPVVEQFNDDSASSEEPVCNDGQKVRDFLLALVLFIFRNLFEV